MDNRTLEFLQEKLAKSEADAEHYLLQADTALQYAEQVWWSWNLRRRRLKVRAVGDCILGYQSDDLEHGEQFWWDRIYPEDRREVEESLQTCFGGGAELWQCEHRMKDIDGDWVWVIQTGFVTRRDRDGNPMEMVGTTRKTHESYQLLDLLRGSESVIGALIDHSPICFWLRDGDGRVLLASRAMNNCFGGKLESPVERQLCKETDVLDWQEAFNTALQGDNVNAEITLRGKDGDYSPYAHHLIPVCTSNAPFAVLEVFLPKNA